MRIGIITIHNSPNYGACLQSYALYKYLANQGYDCEIIDLHRPYQSDYVSSKIYQTLEQQKAASFPFYRVLLLKIKSIYKKIIQGRKSVFTLGAKAKFATFNCEIKLSKPYLGIDDLYKNPPLYDVYITGSDQLWNPMQPYCLEPYFLTFVKKGSAKKISYASSIGLSTLSDSQKINFKKWLEQYDVVSVREKEAQNLLSSFVNKPIYQVADPTFLIDIDEWKSISISPEETEPYILLFTLGCDPLLINYALKIAKESGKQLIILGMYPLSHKGDYTFIDTAGPREFLGYIAHADLVLTNSFHATVFSILMGAKNFYTYIATNNKRGSRIIDLLDTFELQNHLLDNSLNQKMTKLEKNVIDRNKILKIIKNERFRSIQFLNDSLKE